MATTGTRNSWHGVIIATLPTLFPPDKEGCHTYRECHRDPIDRLLLMSLFFRTRHQMAHRVRMVEDQGPAHKAGDMAYMTLSAITRMYRKGDHLVHTPDSLQEAHTIVSHLSMGHRMGHTSDILRHLLDLQSKQQHPIRDRMEQICSFFTFLTTSLTWTCINYFVPTEIC